MERAGQVHRAGNRRDRPNSRRAGADGRFAQTTEIPTQIVKLRQFRAPDSTDHRGSIRAEHWHDACLNVAHITFSRQRKDMAGDVHPQHIRSGESPSGSGTLEWRSRYNGLAVTALLDGKAVAGISGPWSDKFALTWWDRPAPQRQLELFDSLHEAQQKVEAWARRLRTGRSPMASLRAIPSSTPEPVAAASPGMLGWARSLLSPLATRSARPLRGEAIERLREHRARADLDLDGLHFAADK